MFCLHYSLPKPKPLIVGNWCLHSLSITPTFYYSRFQCNAMLLSIHTLLSPFKAIATMCYFSPTSLSKINNHFDTAPNIHNIYLFPSSQVNWHSLTRNVSLRSYPTRSSLNHQNQQAVRLLATVFGFKAPRAWSECEIKLTSFLSGKQQAQGKYPGYQ